MVVKVRKGETMADSNITKRALAAALKELMEETPFEKIQVAHICEKCDMSRKSFYYHFRDKYDLLNWIFDTETFLFFQNLLNANQLGDRMDTLRKLCDYFYENRSFYRKALKIEGQNSFSEHFREYITPILRLRITGFTGENADDFIVNFFTDAVVCAIERWLRDKDCMPPEQFFSKIQNTLERSVDALHKELNELNE